MIVGDLMGCRVVVVGRRSRIRHRLLVRMILMSGLMVVIVMRVGWLRRILVLIMIIRCWLMIE